jgi:hypothetical protein
LGGACCAEHSRTFKATAAPTWFSLRNLLKKWVNATDDPQAGFGGADVFADRA